jgi:hypothetical protein
VVPVLVTVTVSGPSPSGADVLGRQDGAAGGLLVLVGAAALRPGRVSSPFKFRVRGTAGTAREGMGRRGARRTRLSRRNQLELETGRRGLRLCSSWSQSCPA